MTHQETRASSRPLDRRPTRPPVPVIVAIAVVALVTVVGSGGLVYFGVIAVDVNPAAGTPAAIGFTIAGLLLQLAALSQLPGLWRGRARAWHVLTCYLTASVYFGLYKLLVEGETDAVAFLVVDLVVAALLFLPATRRHAGLAR